MDKQATFTEMLNGTAEDYAIIGEHGAKFASELPDRILEHLSILKGDTGGFAVDRFIGMAEMKNMLFVLYCMILVIRSLQQIMQT